ncbi:hypothetical protein BDM02DRAFT_489280 [Thelephora ganbajun]|uniref:Uncharacterized protein n=1 Tax=Thelephora ganbajun TaxID=370292 RepID=A0ACB6Z7E3_THEGA|nr:hypothetical protein BDM02DRAFT_489280 [Thelephora ganbajun]
MNLSFTAGDDVLDCIVFESASGSPIYQLQTPKYSGRVLTTTASRCDGSSWPAFQILWAGTSLEHTKLVLDFTTRAKYKARDIFPGAQGGSTYGSITINNVQYKWKAKGTGPKLVLVNNDTKAVVVESHRRITGNGSFLKTKTPRYMNLDIGGEVVEHTELVLLTFILVWKERIGERAKSVPAGLRGIAPDLTSAVLMNSH